MMFRQMGVVVCLAAVASVASAQSVETWLTNPDRSAVLAKQPEVKFAKADAVGLPVITVDAKKKMQTMDGFGFALTGGSAQLMMQMSPAARRALLRELFDVDGDAIGVSYLRVSIGASDMNDHVYSYDDLPTGEEDRTLTKFSLGEDMKDVVPVLKEILQIAPKIEILGSPWSAPAWMKTNGDVKGGKLKPELYGVYAQYLVKYLQAMKAQGINVTAITVQNEPLNPKNTPSMVMEAEEQRTFIRDAFGPALKKAKLKTKVILYDHNVDEPGYPMVTLKDPVAAKYVAGSGFHLYKGAIDAMSTVHDAFPKKDLYFTEQMVVDRKGTANLAIAGPVARIVIGSTRNWARNVLLWNLAADPQFGPHTNNGGCPVCEGAITLDGDGITRNLGYYTAAHASKFVRPGSVRVDSSATEGLPNVAFRTKAGKVALLVANPGKEDREFALQWKGKTLRTKLAAGAAATYLW
jgi:glucosylceramidase